MVTGIQKSNCCVGLAMGPFWGCISHRIIRIILEVIRPRLRLRIVSKLRFLAEIVM